MKSSHLPSPASLSLAAAVALLVAAAAIPAPVSARQIRKPPPPPATCGDLRDRVIDLAARQAIDRRYPYWYRYALGGLEGAKGVVDTAPSGPGHYTGTNNQEPGVDEADTVKTDGKYIYTIANNQVMILRSWPVSALNIVGRYELPRGVTPRQLLLRGDQLVVLSQVWQPQSALRQLYDAVGWRMPPGFYGTRITVLDVSSRVRPTVQATTDIEGWMAQARLVGDDVYLVTNASLRVPDRMARAADWFARRLPATPANTTDWKAIEKLRAAGLPRIRAYLAAKFRFASLAGAMPRTRTGTGTGNQMSGLRPMYTSCNDVHVPQRAQLGILDLTHIDLDRPGIATHTGVFGSGWQVYASTRALYVAMPVYDANWRARGTTRIHKFAFGAGEFGRPRYAGSGEVRGHLLDQFSMSEHGGYLRVVTTDANSWVRPDDEPTAGGNNLFVLGEQYGKLDVVGAIIGLARGERIYSARMIGDRGYLVTFRQTDPLFTLDLSNPRDPRVAGELEINGFSSYIHPLGKSRLLTIGRDADADGRVKGIHLQIFDVSDPAHPVRTHHRLLTDLRNSWSAATWDHKAFTYDPVTKTLALPVSSYDYRDPKGTFTGLIVYAVDERGGIDELGKIPAKAQVMRSLIIDDAIVSISYTGVQVHDLSNLEASTEPLQTIRFAR